MLAKYIISDFDGVLVDNITPLLKWACSVSPECKKKIEEANLLEEWPKQNSYYCQKWVDNMPDIWDYYCDNENFYDPLEPNKRIFEFVKESHDAGRLHICTRHIYKNGETKFCKSVESKARFIKKWFPNASYNIVAPYNRKYKSILGYNFKDNTPLVEFDAFMEDNPKELEEFHSQFETLDKKREYILVNYGYNQDVSIPNLRRIER